MYTLAFKLELGFKPLLLITLFLAYAFATVVPGVDKQTEVGRDSRQTIDTGFESSRGLEAKLTGRQWEFIGANLDVAFRVGLLLAAAAFTIYGFVIMFEDIIKFEHSHKAERAYTQYYSHNLITAGPWGMNAIVYHDQDSSFSFNVHVHTHTELDIGFDTKGYEGIAFDYGNFTLSGDGGYENWAFYGWFNHDPGSNYVSFYTPAGAGGCGPPTKRDGAADLPRFGGALDDADEEFAASIRGKILGLS